MRKKWMIMGIAVVCASAAAILLSAWVVQRAAQGRTFSDINTMPCQRVGLVLGCSKQLPDGRYNLFYRYRIAAAAELYHAGKVSYLIVSGDNHSKDYDESSAMKDSLIEAGVPSERIYCDYAGFRTFDSVVRAKAIFGQESLAIISQKFQNQRAIFIARHSGIDAIGFNAQEVAMYYSFKTRCRELFARVKTVLDVYVLHARPKFLGPPVSIE